MAFQSALIWTDVYAFSTLSASHGRQSCRKRKHWLRSTRTGVPLLDAPVAKWKAKRLRFRRRRLIQARVLFRAKATPKEGMDSVASDDDDGMSRRRAGLRIRHPSRSFVMYGCMSTQLVARRYGSWLDFLDSVACAFRFLVGRRIRKTGHELQDCVPFLSLFCTLVPALTNRASYPATARTYTHGKTFRSSSALKTCADEHIHRFRSHAGADLGCPRVLLSLMIVTNCV